MAISVDSAAKTDSENLYSDDKISDTNFKIAFVEAYPTISSSLFLPFKITLK